MSLVKLKLKAAREAINKKDFTSALSAATEALTVDPKNYNALVFSGLSLLELGDHKSSEDLYTNATQISPEQPLAWQGLLRLCSATRNITKTLSTLDELLHIFSRNGDSTKCAETAQKILDVQREHGSRLQIIAALELFLPGSIAYSTLSLLPPPDPTQPTATTTLFSQKAVHQSLPVYEEILNLIESEEEQEISREVERRRLRLTSGRPEDIRNDVGCAVWDKSKLPYIYNQVINHVDTSDDVRRKMETELFRYKMRHLHAMPVDDTKKLTTRKELDEMSRGFVVLGVPNELAWVAHLEAKDVEQLEGYDLNMLRQFVFKFPESSVSKAISGWFYIRRIPLYNEEEIPETAVVFNNSDVAFQAISDAYQENSESIVIHRILVQIYLEDSDYGNTIKIADAALQLVRRTETAWGRQLKLVKIALSASTATALVHYFPPKYHLRALDIIQTVLIQFQDNVACLVARAHILKYQKAYADSRNIFSRVVQLLDDGMNSDIRLEVEEEVAWCDSLSGKHAEAIKALRSILGRLQDVDGQSDRVARVWWRLGRTLWDENTNESRLESYRHFIAALKSSPTFAPAYTSLGIYYSECSSPSDPLRASKCFQKAVELDSREGEAARRLAEGFADEQEWDLVEIVARRIVEGEGGTEGDMAINAAAAAARYKPVYAWAWKAIGIVELNHGNYSPAITSLQIALRADNEDFVAWTRLGEAYLRSGKSAAALKALLRAQTIAPDDWTCKFFTAEVYGQMGLFDKAIDSLRQILSNRLDDVGVLLFLGDMQLAKGRSEFSTGFLSRAEVSLAEAIKVSCHLLSISSGFRRVAWKVAADAALELAKLTEFAVVETVSDAADLLLSAVESESLTMPHSSVESPGILALHTVKNAIKNELCGKTLAPLAVLAYCARIRLCDGEGEMFGAAHFDYSVALFHLSSLLKATEAKSLVMHATMSLKLALREDSSNELYWNALASVTFTSDPKVAQHAFIKGIELDTKNPIYWTNLGLLYLHYGDSGLANMALYKAQVLNPEYSLAWVGQAFVAISNNHLPDARAVLEHALTLPVTVPQAEYEYAYRVFRDCAEDKLAEKYELVAPYLALRRYCSQMSMSAPGLHLFALICEQSGHLELARELFEHALIILERAYEESEDAETERRYAIASVNLGRIKLACADHIGARDTLEGVIGLLGNVKEVEEYEETLIRVQANFGIGLALFKLGELEAALASFEAAGEAVPEDSFRIKGQVTMLTAQTLWAIGSEEAREVSRDQLLQCIGEDSGNLGAITTLFAMGILSDNVELVDAALAEIKEMPIEQRRSLDPSGDVDKLMYLNYLNSGRTEQALELLKIRLEQIPTSPEARIDLSRHLLQSKENASALAVLQEVPEAAASGETSQIRDTGLWSIFRHRLEERLRLEATAGLLPNVDSENVSAKVRSSAVKAVMLAPWEPKNRALLSLSHVQ